MPKCLSRIASPFWVPQAHIILCWVAQAQFHFESSLSIWVPQAHTILRWVAQAQFHFQSSLFIWMPQVHTILCWAAQAQMLFQRNLPILGAPSPNYWFTAFFPYFSAVRKVTGSGKR